MFGIRCGKVDAWRGVLMSLVAVWSLAGGAAGAALAGSKHASMVIDANTGKVLHDQSADDPRYPASLTKLMTLYIVFEMMEQGKLSPGTRIAVSAHAAGVSPTKLGVKAGSTIALGDAVRALIVNSANDMAVAVAEHVAGSVEQFAELMTRKAQQIGMAHTTFRNPHGLPDPGQITTARDMLTLALRLNDEFPQQYKLFSLKSFTYNGRSHRNHNTMLSTYEGMDGLKTGYTQASGFNLVASVRRDGRHVVAAVFGGSSAAARNVYMRAILNRSLPVASTERTRKLVAVARADVRSRAGKVPRPVPADAPAPQLVEALRPAVAPEHVAFSTAPAPAAKVAVAKVKPAPVAAGARSEPQGHGPRIDIAHVRTVPVTPRPRPEAPQRPGTAAVAAATDQREARPFLTTSIARGSASFTAAAPRQGLGAPPSTLQAQASRLRQGAPAVEPYAPPPANRAPSIRAPGVAVQVGAYATEADARRQLSSARGKAAPLASAEGRAEPVSAGAKQLWRARFVGLDEPSASDACSALRRQQIDCHVARVQ